MGEGSYGGKASGLISIKKTLLEKINSDQFPHIEISLPRMVVIRTDVFDSFMKRNNLFELAFSDESDIRKANGFLKADLPVEILGDLHS